MTKNKENKLEKNFSMRRWTGGVGRKHGGGDGTGRARETYNWGKNSGADNLVSGIVRIPIGLWNIEYEFPVRDTALYVFYRH